MSPRTKQQNEKIRQEKSRLILESALKLFADKGYHTSSISQIAKAAGISKGLVYNYFESKEDLLQNIFFSVMKKFTSDMHIEEKDQYTIEESRAFFDSMFDILIRNPNEWKLYYQLSMQTEVMEILMKNMSSHNFESYQKTILQHLTNQNFKDPEVAILLFTSVLKGFVLQYAFAPEMFSLDLIARFKEKFRMIFFGKEINDKSPDEIELNDKLSYFLL